MHKDRFSAGFVTLAAMMWALDPPFRKLLSIGFSSPAIVLMEHLLIAACVLPLFLPRLPELHRLGWREWLAVAFVGVGGSASATILFTQSFHYLSPSVAILLQKLQPLIGIGLASVILGEGLSRRFLAWGAIALAGGYIVSFPNFAPAGVSMDANLHGVLLALGAAALWGGSTVFGRFVLNRVSFQMMTSLRFLTGLVFLVAVNLAAGTTHEIAAATPRDWLLVFILAIVAGFISLLIYYYGLRSTRASVATLCELAYPLAAVILNWAILGDTLSSMQILGGLMLLTAITRLSVAQPPDIHDDLVPARL